MGNFSTVLIVGGGIIGSAIAWEMRKRGIKTTLLEKGAFASEATTASAGMICPHAVRFDEQLPLDIAMESYRYLRVLDE